MSPLIPVIDLFAGPGGLNEGFAQLGEREQVPVFNTVGSFEMETSACSTLRLRGAYRKLFRGGAVPEIYYQFIRGQVGWDDFSSDPRIAAALDHSAQEVHQIELGVERSVSDAMIGEALRAHDVDQSTPWVLIGGPPCQAYSLAGRSRRANDAEFENDKKHFLYREYLHIISEFQPPVFVMENVKGLLSSTNSGEGMFEKIKKDLQRPRVDLEYDIHSLAISGDVDSLAPSDYVIRAERYGVPQRRHRVILLGVRKELFPHAGAVGRLRNSKPIDVETAIGALPKLRSGISPSRFDNPDDWYAVRAEAEALYSGVDHVPSRDIHAAGRGGPYLKGEVVPSKEGRYAAWVADPRIGGVVQHESRSHMAEDLKRYWFAATHAESTGTSPRLRDFPESLLPKHRNARSELRPFEDRFRVQVGNQPSTTVVSHIAKDGHYYIHPDASQMRSLTVREAARLQTFPDNYYFMGNRTQQYHQVGNAVPPLLANQIAKVVAALLTQHPLGE